MFISPSKLKILNIFWSYCTCLLIIFPNVTGKYVLHPTFAVRMYLFTFIPMHIKHGWYKFIFISFIKIIVAFDSTPNSSFYTDCCHKHSDYKLIDDGHLEFSHEKVDENKETVFFSVLLGQYKWKTQLFKIYTNTSQDVYLLHNCVYCIYLFNAFVAGIGLFSFFYSN